MAIASHSSCNVLTVEDAEGLLQRLNLLLPPRDAILIADTSINTRGLELLIVRKSSIKLLLRAIKISLLLLQCLLLILLLTRLVLNVLRLLGLVNRGVTHELVILLLRLGLSSARLRLQTCKVRLDHLNHANNATVLCPHALVGLVKDLRLLHKGCGLCSLGVKLLEHTEGLCNCSLCILGVLDCDGVLCLLLLAHAGGLGHSRIKLSNSLGELSNLLSELGNGCL